jgi:hypothetical protein
MNSGREGFSPEGAAFEAFLLFGSVEPAMIWWTGND